MVGRAFLAGILVSTASTLAAAAEILPPPEAPGVVASADQDEVCGYAGGLTYSKRHRQTTPEMKAEAHRGQRTCGEIDHRLPLALGGADDVHNLKDRLEVYVWHAVCKTHSMTLADGQAVFLRPDWRDAYCTLVGGPPCDASVK
jgi:hypothetical protein